VNFVGKISPPPFGARVPLPAPAPDLAWHCRPLSL